MTLPAIWDHKFFFFVTITPKATRNFAVFPSKFLRNDDNNYATVIYGSIIIVKFREKFWCRYGKSKRAISGNPFNEKYIWSQIAGSVTYIWCPLNVSWYFHTKTDHFGMFFDIYSTFGDINNIESCVKYKYLKSLCLRPLHKRENIFPPFNKIGKRKEVKHQSFLL